MATLLYDALVIGLFIGLSLGIAELLALSRPYWVPVSCAAIIQGASMRAAWSKQFHRVLGTVAGVGLAWALLTLPLNPWTFCLVMVGLMLCIETLVVRNYASAVVFITPLTVYLAEAMHLPHIQVWPVIHARVIDTVLGALIGVLGALVLHHPGLRARTQHAVQGWFSGQTR